MKRQSSHWFQSIEETCEALRSPERFIAARTDVLVVGAGHAGCEAALAVARLGCRTILFTLTLDSLANLPCNPNIGGTAKGQLVREIDALGGEMGKVADRQMIQFRQLNRSKGPAVVSPRVQIDRIAYQRDMKQQLERQPNLQLIQAEVTALLTVDGPSGEKIVCGVVTKAETVYLGKTVILATGTFLNSRGIVGDAVYESGPDGLAGASALTSSLKDLSLPLRRFKTGTPVRIRLRSVKTELCERQDGDPVALPFSYDHEDDPNWRPKADIPCWLTWTTDETREIVLSNLDRSPLYSGVIEGVGPRYCPSIEDKYVKFPAHKRHHLFIEPTGLDTDEYYLAGLSSSMPESIQYDMLKSVEALAEAEVSRIGYAIEYDCVDPTALKLSLETRQVSGLFLAGQINGSSGYEEAAAQGLIAGVNAVRLIREEAPLLIDRASGYIGVLIDDLVTKGTDEPYRLMTARAEYRLLLRSDNADLRLTPLGREAGLISDARWARFERRREQIETERARLDATRVPADDKLAAVLKQHDSSPVRQNPTLAELLRRPELSYEALAPVDPERPHLPPGVVREVVIQIRYEGYIRVELERIARFRKLEHRLLPADLPYEQISGIRLEARQRLAELKPQSIGQAGRIAGVTPADISVLLVFLEQWQRRGEGSADEGASG